MLSGLICSELCARQEAAGSPSRFLWEQLIGYIMHPSSPAKTGSGGGGGVGWGGGAKAAREKS